MADRVAVLAGATGLVGRAVLEALLTAETGTAGAAGAPALVHVLHARGRRAPALSHPRLQLHAVDFTASLSLPAADEVYLALGTTLAAAGSRSAFRAVDHGAVIATARAARAAGATRCGLISAIGADARSPFFYNRTKGEVERDLQTLGFETLVIARPSLLLGDREALGQPRRGAESLAAAAAPWLDPLLPERYRARPGEDIGRALVHAVQTRPAGVHVLSGRDLLPP